MAGVTIGRLSFLNDGRNDQQSFLKKWRPLQLQTFVYVFRFWVSLTNRERLFSLTLYRWGRGEVWCPPMPRLFTVYNPAHLKMSPNARNDTSEKKTVVHPLCLHSDFLEKPDLTNGYKKETSRGGNPEKNVPIVQRKTNQIKTPPSSKDLA
mmetsp:Transcript_6638/g.6819  ORF Transcript_6638/g.6819 Transcript_6638/m.6819 type:complete len:151 (+) Transcript_6638:86-538(+)